MKRQYTATVYLFHAGKVLLHFHKKLGKWLPPGGHCEEGETPPEAARREVFEETGLSFEFLSESPFFMDAPHAKTIERPFLCLLENIPETPKEPAHQHIDSIYLGRPTTSPLPADLPNGFRWFSPEEIPPIAEDLFLDTRKFLLETLSPPAVEAFPALLGLFYAQRDDLSVRPFS